MSDCCMYYLAQAYKNGTWVDIGFSSKNLEEINQEVTNYKKSNPTVIIRIMQRSIKEDRNKKVWVPKCC